MNWGTWFSSSKKLVLTLVNMFCICVGIVLVSFPSLPSLLRSKLMNLSVGLGFTLPAKLSIMTPAVGVFPARIMRDEVLFGLLPFLFFFFFFPSLCLARISRSCSYWFYKASTCEFPLLVSFAASGMVPGYRIL